MVRAFLYFALFTMATTAPLQDHARIKLRNNIDMNSLITEQSEENDIPENIPIKEIGEIGEMDEKHKAYNSYIKVEPASLDKKTMNIDYSDASENDDYNLIDSHERDKPESTLSAFITVLEEFMKSIVEELVKMYKN